MLQHFFRLKSLQHCTGQQKGLDRIFSQFNQTLSQLLQSTEILESQDPTIAREQLQRFETHVDLILSPNAIMKIEAESLDTMCNREYDKIVHVHRKFPEPTTDQENQQSPFREYACSLRFRLV
ncbi:hypothetical protein ACOSQ4_014020 [Xanthoceras sorbifolium]